jgi:hypothetical protein
MERVHDDIGPPASLTWRTGNAKHWISPEIEAEALTRRHHRSEWLVFEIEQIVRIDRRPVSEDQKLPWAHLPPQEIAAPIRSIRKQGPDQRMSGTEPRTRLFGHKDAGKRVCRTISS